LFRLLFFFEVQKFELLGLALPCKNNVSKNMYFYRLLLLKVVISLPQQTPSTHFPPNTSGHAQLSNNTG